MDFDGKKSVDFAVLVPSLASILAKKVQGSPVGTLSVKYSISESVGDGEYNDDEQLYAAMTSSYSKERYRNHELSILGAEGAGLWVFMNIPPSDNPITYNLIAQALVRNISAKTWITVAPGSFYGHTICKLESQAHPGTEEIPQLRPPHFVTGIAAAINRQASDVLCLVVNAEGQPGYERIDVDALVDASYVIGSILHLGNSYTKAVSKAVRRSESNSIYV